MVEDHMTEPSPTGMAHVTHLVDTRGRGRATALATSDHVGDIGGKGMVIGTSEALAQPILVRRFDCGDRVMRQIGDTERLGTDGTTEQNAKYAAAPIAEAILGPGELGVSKIKNDPIATGVALASAGLPEAAKLPVSLSRAGEVVMAIAPAVVQTAPAKRQQVKISGPGMGRMTVVVNDVIVTPTTIALVYPEDGSVAICEPPATEMPDGEPLTLVIGPTTYKALCLDLSFSRGGELHLVFVRIPE